MILNIFLSLFLDFIINANKVEKKSRKNHLLEIIS